MGVFNQGFFTHRGLNTISNDIVKEPLAFGVWENAMLELDGAIHTRYGYKAVAPRQGGQGLFKHAKRDVDTGVETLEMLAIGDGALHRAEELTFTISYTGSNAATLSFCYDNTTGHYRIILVDGGSTVLNQALGRGVGGDTPKYTAAELETDISAVSDFSAVITGDADTAISAAYLFPLHEETDLSTDVVLTAYSWTKVKGPLAAPFSGNAAQMDSAEYELVNHTSWNSLSYFANIWDDVMKYDGENVYRAGVPKASTPIGEEVTATGAAQVVDITAIEDTSQAEITQVLVVGSGSNFIGQRRINAYDAAGSVAIVVSTAPVAYGGADRSILVTVLSGDTSEQVAGKIETAVHADSKFTASSSGDTAIITNVDTIPITDFTKGGGGNTFTISTLQQGTNGLDGNYFTLYENNAQTEPALLSVAVWFDKDDSGTPEPAHGATRSIEVTGINTGDSATQVATAIASAINADASWSATSLGAVITATFGTTGQLKSPDMGASGFTSEITTLGTSGGLGAETYNHHITFEQRDAQGIFTEGTYSENITTTVVASKNIDLTIQTIQPDTGFNTKCAIIDGDQTGVTTITVLDTPHTLEVGDVAAIKGVDGSPVSQIETISCVADVSDSLDGAYFYIYSLATGSIEATAVWIDVDDSGTAEPSHGAPNSIEITTITTDMTDSQVASAIAAVLHAEADWSASAVSEVITLTHATKGNVLDGYDGGVSSTGFSFAVTTNGENNTSGALVHRSITAVSTTSITIEGDAVSVVDADAISNGLLVNVWRTEAGDANTFNKFLVDTFPNNSLVGSVVYTDSVVDVDLGAPWNEPEFDHDLPPRVAYLAVWNKVLVLGGAPSSPSTVYYSIPFEFSPEYFPDEANQLGVESGLGDQIRGLHSLQEGVMILKDRSWFPLTGDIFTGNIRVDKKTKADFHFISHNSIVEVGGGILYADLQGVYALNTIGDEPAELSNAIHPTVNNVMPSVSKRRCVSYFDRGFDRAVFHFPAMVTATDGTEVVVDRDNSTTLVYDTARGIWYEWKNLDLSGGAIEFNDEYFFQSWLENTTSNDREVHLYRWHQEPIACAKEDHNEAIDVSIKSGWLRQPDPGDYKSYVNLKLYASGLTTTVDSALTVTTEINDVADVAHSTMSWDATLFGGEKRFRLKPAKVKSLRLAFSNSAHNTNSIITGWQFFGKSSDRGGIEAK